MCPKKSEWTDNLGGLGTSHGTLASVIWNAAMNGDSAARPRMARRAGAVASSGITEAVSDTEGNQWRAGSRLGAGPIGAGQRSAKTEGAGRELDSNYRNQKMPNEFWQHQDETDADKQGGYLKFGVVCGRLAFVPGVKAIGEWCQRRENQDQERDELKDTARHPVRIFGLTLSTQFDKRHGVSGASGVSGVSP